MCLDHPHGAKHAHVHVRGVERPLRVAVVGKGGAGKITIAGALARVLDRRGLRVLAVDADPDANLASALPLEGGAPPEPLARRHDLLREAAEQGGAGRKSKLPIPSDNDRSVNRAARPRDTCCRKGLGDPMFPRASITRKDERWRGRAHLSPGRRGSRGPAAQES